MLKFTDPKFDCCQKESPKTQQHRQNYSHSTFRCRHDFSSAGCAGPGRPGKPRRGPHRRHGHSHRDGPGPGRAVPRRRAGAETRAVTVTHIPVDMTAAGSESELSLRVSSRLLRRPRTQRASRTHDSISDELEEKKRGAGFRGKWLPEAKPPPRAVPQARSHGASRARAGRDTKITTH